MKPTFSLGIPTTPWIPERVEALARLLAQIAEGPPDEPEVRRHHRVFGERETNWAWSERMWTWGAEQETTHFVTVQDDATVAQNFWPSLRAMVEAVPDQVICLQVAHPAARALAEEGYRWFTTADAMVGVAYVLPVSVLREFLAWRETKLKPELVELAKAGNTSPLSHEDTLLALFCLATGRRIWHPLPTIVDHDTELASTYGNDEHTHRRSPVRWTSVPPADEVLLEDADFWRGRDPVRGADGRVLGWSQDEKPAPHVGRFPGWSVPQLAAQAVEGFGNAEYMRAMQDDGRAEVSPMVLRRRAREIESGRASRARIMLATPTLGAHHPEYTRTMMNLAVRSEWELQDTWQIESGAPTVSSDLVRTRSRLVRMFLETRATHLLFVDDDVSFEPVTLAGMLASNHDFVATPYPKRAGVRWDAIARLAPAGHHPEIAAYSYNSVRLLKPLPIRPEDLDAAGCIEVAAVGMGCVLLSRDMLERMVEHYRAELSFKDDAFGHAETVALFHLILGGGALMGEDLSFCMRWRQMGGRIHLYLGNGSPATHHGDMAFRGRLEAFGLTRGT